MAVHSMRRSLDEAAKYVDAPWWEAVYRQAFPSYQSMAAVTDYGVGQQLGIDRHVALGNGRTITVDEKVRTADYDDFALEFWSDHERRVPGWVAKDLACDYIAYAFIPSQRCYLLPFPQLRRAWGANRHYWVDHYRDPERHVARNFEDGRSWNTHFVPVPISVVMAAVSEAMVVTWDSIGKAA